MSDTGYIKRMCEEYIELNDKSFKLRDYIYDTGREDYLSLPVKERRLMQQQLKAMRQYRIILWNRIDKAMLREGISAERPCPWEGENPSVWMNEEEELDADEQDKRGE